MCLIEWKVYKCATQQQLKEALKLVTKQENKVGESIKQKKATEVA
jgi:hypothetical protein